MARESKQLGSFDAIDLFSFGRAQVDRSFTLSELSELTGRARSTVALRLEELLAAGLVASGPTRPSTTPGRPSARFSFEPVSWGTIAIDIGRSHNLVALLNLSGQIIAEGSFVAEMADGPVAVLDAAAAAASTLMADSDHAGWRIAAVGVGIALPVFHEEGRPFNSTNLPEWDHFDVPGHLATHFSVPVLVDNDANLMALGELALRPDAAEMIAVEASTGIGAGIINNGALLRGAKGAAGAIGHIPVPRDADVPCICGRRGCLVAVASGPAIAASLSDLGVTAAGVDDVVELALSGNLEAIAAVRRAGNDIGEILTTCISFFNPALIAVGGRLATAGNHLVAGIREVIYQKATPFATEGLSVVRSLEPVRAALIGAGIMATEFALSEDNLRRLVSSHASAGS
ncbi:ROK family protein [Microbacterium capsulatum]|uniref:ROK family protein n=1 Tax=Microbacterium capsulatum TaxID=3041921 RepID=A0ABU0XF28_9MICO|nr:ROK family protein [Microbacterium sp. ASV81]MDQ4213702.1 ROK family protein [Microbacterium sp. ASV81]